MNTVSFGTMPSQRMMRDALDALGIPQENLKRTSSMKAWADYISKKYKIPQTLYGPEVVYTWLQVCVYIMPEHQAWDNVSHLSNVRRWWALKIHIRDVTADEVIRAFKHTRIDVNYYDKFKNTKGLQEFSGFDDLFKKGPTKRLIGVVQASMTSKDFSYFFTLLQENFSGLTTPVFLKDRRNRDVDMIQFWKQNAISIH